MSEKDGQLIGEFNDSQNEQAFAALVQRHVNLVFATALRQVGDRGIAEEVTQNVFITLAQSAGKLGRHPTIAGWLYQTTLNKSRERLRFELRRQRREQVAVNLERVRSEGDSVWASVVPLLDEALLELREADRLAVIMHFMEGQTFGEVGVTLGVGEDAARKRVHRCLEQLTGFFRRRGFAVPALAAGAPLFVMSSQAAPAGLSASVVTAGLGASHVAASSSTLTLIKGALKIMAWTKMKTAVVVGVAGVLVVGITSITVTRLYPVEPRYQGKPLSEWLKQYRSNSETTLPTTFNESDRRVAMQKRIASQNQARDAIRHIGSEAVPILLKWANTTNSIGRKEPFVPGYDFARIGFSVLGATAQSAVPTLKGMLTNEDFDIRGCAVLDLGDVGTNAADALPAAIELMKNDKEYYLRAWAAAAVGDIGINQPDRIIPILLEALNTTNNPALRANSLASLGKLGVKAKIAVPFIVPYLTNDDSVVSAAAAYALWQIDR